MKKIIITALAALLALSLAACGGTSPDTGSDAATTEPTVNAQPSAGHTFAPNGIAITIGAEPSSVLAALGKELDSFTLESCAIDAKDIEYRYQGFRLNVTYPEKGEPYITGIQLTDDTFQTPERLYIGSPAEDIKMAYGPDCKEENSFYTYTQGRSTLQFHEKEGLVDQILYGYIFDEE